MECGEKSVGKKWGFGRKCGGKKTKGKRWKSGKKVEEKSEFWGRKNPLRKMGKILENGGIQGKIKCWKREGEKWEKRGKNEEKKSGM